VSTLHHRSKGLPSERPRSKRDSEMSCALVQLDQRKYTEPTSTQNISSRGARVIDPADLGRREAACSSALRSGSGAQAHVVYWRSSQAEDLLGTGVIFHGQATGPKRQD